MANAMHNKNKLIRLVVLSISLIFSQLSWAQSFSDFYFFGDSLSDVGNNPELGHKPYSDGANWVQFFTKIFGQTVTYSDNGGNDYAYGGAQTDTSSPGKAAGNRGLQSQAAVFLTQHQHLDPAALYVIWIGANDVFNGILKQGKTPTDIANQGANNITEVLVKLHDAGAKYLVLGNLTDLAETPLGHTLSPQVQQVISSTAALFNAKVLAAIKTVGFPVITIDYYSLFNAIVRDPSHYGFTHSYTEQCIKHQNSICQEYIFWDNLHPTEAAYKIVADYTYKAVTAAD